MLWLLDFRTAIYSVIFIYEEKGRNVVYGSKKVYGYPGVKASDF